MSIQDNWRMRRVGEIAADNLEQQRVRREHIPGQPGALGGEMTVEALPTYYGGTTFRSALEASWAATLDTLNIAWEYEPETITLPSGAVYIPDFRLPDVGTWLEVKGAGVPRVEKAHEFGQSLACTHPPFGCDCRWPGGELVIVGLAPQPYRLLEDPELENATYAITRNVSRRRAGHPAWKSTRPNTAWLTRCPDCDRGGWIDTGQCRACGGHLRGTHAYGSGEFGIEFRRIKGPARTRDEDPTEAA